MNKGLRYHVAVALSKMRKAKLSFTNVHGQTMLKKYSITDLQRSTVQNIKANNKQGTANENAATGLGSISAAPSGPAFLPEGVSVGSVSRTAACNRAYTTGSVKDIISQKYKWLKFLQGWWIRILWIRRVPWYGWVWILWAYVILQALSQALNCQPPDTPPGLPEKSGAYKPGRYQPW